MITGVFAMLLNIGRSQRHIQKNVQHAYKLDPAMQTSGQRMAWTLTSIATRPHPSAPEIPGPIVSGRPLTCYTIVEVSKPILGYRYFLYVMVTNAPEDNGATSRQSGLNVILSHADT